MGKHNQQDIKRMKKLSIITINYNDKIGLARTIKSVITQTHFPNIQFIIIDGGSSDGSREVIEQYKDKLDYWCCEKDNGIYDAMNKGIGHAECEFIQFLNSGDWLYRNDTIGEIINHLDADIVLGKTCHVYHDNKCEIKRDFNNEISIIDLYYKSINHQAAFVRSHLYKTIGFDAKLKICADWKFFLNALLFYNASFKTIDTIIVNYDMQGISSVNESLYRKEREMIWDELQIPAKVKDLVKMIRPSTYQFIESINNRPRVADKICPLLSKFLKTTTKKQR